LTLPPTSSLEDTCPAEPAAEENTRQWLLQQLREIMEIAMQRVTNSKTPAPDRIKWSRIAIAAGQACNAILRDVEIDALRQQISELKQLTISKLSDDQGGETDED
jgi:predicted DNA-binding transcriptional regulator YafY